MSSRFPSYSLLLAATLLLVLIALPRVALGQGQATFNAEPIRSGKRSNRPFDAKFVDIAQEAGLDVRFVYGSNTQKKYIVEANGGGVAFIDYDNDGWLDIFVSNGSSLDGAPPGATSRLYHNDRRGRFEDVSEAAGVKRAGWGAAVCGGDYNNDGFTDLFVSYWGVNSLYRNRGDGTFADVAAAAGVAGPSDEWTSGCTFLDYDHDGQLDLFVSQYQKFDIRTAPRPGKSATCEWKGMPVFCGPRGLPWGGVTLYHNEGNGVFRDASDKTGIHDIHPVYAFTPVAADFDGDGWIDIYVACDTTPNLLFMNNGDGTFSDFGTETGLAFNEHGFEQGGMGIGIGDFNQDGHFDMVKTNFAGDYPNVYANEGDGFFQDIVVMAGLAVNPQVVGWGIELADLDNDGWQDVFQVDGHVYPSLDHQDKVSERFRQPNIVYRNLGKGKFEDVTDLAGPGLKVKKSSRGSAFGDFDNDGDIDVVVMNMGDTPSLFRNDLNNDNHWVRVQLQGVKSNRSAIGAVVTVEAGAIKLADAVVSQSSYASFSDLRLFFGLGKEDRVKKITVRWPNGEQEIFPGAAADRTLLLVEGSGETRAAKVEPVGQ